MAELILHHYDLSPFSEKIGFAFGYKDLRWHAVEVPIWPPWPGTAAMAAGYRRIPVLQVGADIYCDTLLILREIDRWHPEPTLYPDDQIGLASALGWWIDTTLFFPAASVTASIIGDNSPGDFIADRIAFMNRDVSRAASLRELPVSRQRVAAQMTILADILKDGRPFLLGPNLSVADLCAYHLAWFMRKSGGPEVEAMLPFAPLREWMDHVSAVGHGQRIAMSPEAALAIARAAQPAEVSGVAPNDPSGLKGGERVVIRTDDSNDLTSGTLVGADEAEIVIRHDDTQVGSVHLHFPRFGYSVVVEAA